MEAIQMVDLQRQYRKLKHEMDAAMQEVLDSARFIRGPQVKAFEDSLGKYMDHSRVVSCANGTDALQAAMMALDLKEGDEIITTNFTFIATVEVVELLKLKLVLADPDPNTFNLTAEQVEKALTPRTKAVVPVHLFGQCAPMKDLLELAQLHSFHIIEDTAQATGADYMLNGQKLKAGTLGTLGCTSFFPSKNLGCYGDGGAVFTKDEELASRLRSITNHGMTQGYHYDHIGMNSRLDSLQAAILSVKLKYLDECNRERQKLAAEYDRHFGDLPGLQIPARDPLSTHIFHQYTLKVPETKRDKLKAYLQEHQIPAMVYYPRPLHSQKAYAHLGYKDGDFPVTEQLCKEVISLPMHPEMDEEQTAHIIETVRKFFT